MKRAERRMSVVRSDVNECVIYYRGWTVSVVCLCHLPLEWGNLQLTSSDNRPRPQLWDEFKPLKSLEQEEYHAIKKRAIGVIKKQREAAEKRRERERAKRREAARSPKFL